MRYMQAWEEKIYDRKEGEARLNRLYINLLEADRLEDLKRATMDEAFREQLYEEFNIE